MIDTNEMREWAIHSRDADVKVMYDTKVILHIADLIDAADRMYTWSAVPQGKDFAEARARYRGVRTQK